MILFRLQQNPAAATIVGFLLSYPRSAESAQHDLVSEFAGLLAEFDILRNAEKRTINGMYNNEAHPFWGMAGAPLRKKTHPQPGYADYLPNPREISNEILDDTASVPEAKNEMSMSDMLWQWGQFVDHDFVLVEHGSNHMDIDIPLGDPVFNPNNLATVKMPFARSKTTMDESGKVAPMNSITAYLDGSAVYGSDDDRVLQLRTLNGGLLKTSDGNLLPFNDVGLPNAPHATLANFHVAGDVRANEQLGLLAIQTLFVREHNYIANALAEAFYPAEILTDEELYQLARIIVGAEIQRITYHEFLSAVLGPHALKHYKEYNASCNAGIFDEFATAAFRLGHTLVGSCISPLEQGMAPTEGTCMSLGSVFFNPSKLQEVGGLDNVMRGLAGQMCQGMDHRIVDPLRNMLFKGTAAVGHGVGLDLAALNIQRGRDHGIGTYNDVRVAYGLQSRDSFSEITEDADLASALVSVFGTPDNMDPWVGMIIEPHVNGAMVGETIHTILVDQFENMRNCDRFWYENHLKGTAELLKIIESTTLTDIIRRNTANVGEEIYDYSMMNPFMYNGEVINPPPTGGERRVNGNSHVARNQN